MSRFIETIRLEHGQFPALDRHLNRIQETIRQQHGVMPTGIEAAIHQRPFPSDGRYRVRIEYDLNGEWEMQCFPYMRKKIEKMRIVHFTPPDYRFKYANRDWLNSLINHSDADEVLIIRENMVTDTTIANIAFTDGRTWWTPDTPLLAGTERCRLLDAGIIQEQRISLADITSFSGFRLFNAMLPWEDEVTYGMSVLRF